MKDKLKSFLLVSGCIALGFSYVVSGGAPASEYPGPASDAIHSAAKGFPSDILLMIFVYGLVSILIYLILVRFKQ